MKEAEAAFTPAACGLLEKPKQRKWEVAGICSVLVILVFLVFGQTLGHEFVNYDDQVYVYDNPMVSRGLTVEGLGRAFMACCDNWQPLTMISHMLDCQSYGLWAGGHHLTNVLLHAAGAVLLFSMLREMTGMMWRSAFVAAVFAIHPLRAESVAWVAERKDVLSGIFFMLTLWAYAWYARQKDSNGPSRRLYIMVVVWFALGLLSKPMLVTAPFVLLLLDYWPLRRLPRTRRLPRMLLEKLPLFALSALSGLATMIAGRGAILPLARFPLPMRVENAVVAYAVYLGKLVCPARLTIDYPMLENGWPVWQVVAAFMLSAVLTAWAFLSRRKQQYLLVGWLWYLGMLVPVIGIFQVGAQAYADRYTYLPQIGLCFAATWAAADWAGDWWHRCIVLRVLAVAILCGLLVAAHRQTTNWSDSITLWTHTLGCTKDNSIAHNNLGNALLQKGRTEEGIARFRDALRINPAYTEAHNNLGNVLLKQGRVEESIAHFRTALQLNPISSVAHYNLGVAVFQQGGTEEAIDHFRKAVQLDPVYSKARNNLAIALLRQGKAEEAIEELRETLQIDPAYADARYNLGNALLQQGKAEEAISQYRETLRIVPADAEAHNNLGNALLQQGRGEEAITHYGEALRINPRYVEAHVKLGATLLGLGRWEEAIAHTQKALEIQPSNGTIQNNLAWMLATAPQASLRNGVRALELAMKASEASSGNDPLTLSTLAAAYSETGDFSNAQQTARKALQLAEAQSNTDLARKLRREIKLYEARQPYREDQ